MLLRMALFFLNYPVRISQKSCRATVKAASRAQRILFIKDGEVFHQIYRGEATSEQLYQKISDTLTMLQGGERA